MRIALAVRPLELAQCVEATLSSSTLRPVRSFPLGSSWMTLQERTASIFGFFGQLSAHQQCPSDPMVYLVPRMPRFCLGEAADSRVCCIIVSHRSMPLDDSRPLNPRFSRLPSGQEDSPYHPQCALRLFRQFSLPKDLVAGKFHFDTAIGSNPSACHFAFTFRPPAVHIGQAY